MSMSDNVIQCPHCSKPIVIPKGIDKEEIQEMIEGKLGDFCDRFPELCQQTANLEEKVNKLVSIAESHVAPQQALVDEWKSCPDCKPKLEKLIKDGAFKLEEEKVKVEESDFPWVDRSASR